jgi:hypothetical protein
VVLSLFPLTVSPPPHLAPHVLEQLLRNLDEILLVGREPLGRELFKQVVQCEVDALGGQPVCCRQLAQQPREQPRPALRRPSVRAQVEAELNRTPRRKCCLLFQVKSRTIRVGSRCAPPWPQ